MPARPDTRIGSEQSAPGWGVGVQWSERVPGPIWGPVECVVCCEAGIEPEGTAGWEAQADAIREAADESGVLSASLYDEFNGTHHDEDPRKKGYIAADG
jgi:hypothetical protein